MNALAHQASLWNATQYLLHNELRTRPAADLMQRVMSFLLSSSHATTSNDSPSGATSKRVYDLGCGPGNSTRVVCSFLSSLPGVHTVTGVDFAHDMLKRARTEFEKSTLGASMNVNFEQRDLSSWVPDEKNIDLIFSNALYHWIPDHQSLFPRLLAAVKPETGILAIQMPRNFRAPSHTILRALALDSQYEWSQYLSKEGALGAAEPVADPAVYYNMLAPHASRVDIWETEYLQPLAPAANPVLEWVRGTTLVPYQSVLTREGVPKGLWEQFEAEYAARLRAAYPADAQTGITLYPFKRIFIVASPKS